MPLLCPCSMDAFTHAPLFPCKKALAARQGLTGKVRRLSLPMGTRASRTCSLVLRHACRICWLQAMWVHSKRMRPACMQLLNERSSLWRDVRGSG